MDSLRAKILSFMRIADTSQTKKPYTGEHFTPADVYEYVSWYNEATDPDKMPDPERLSRIDKMRRHYLSCPECRNMLQEYQAARQEGISTPEELPEVGQIPTMPKGQVEKKQNELLEKRNKTSDPQELANIDQQLNELRSMMNHDFSRGSSWVSTFPRLFR